MAFSPPPSAVHQASQQRPPQLAPLQTSVKAHHGASSQRQPQPQPTPSVSISSSQQPLGSGDEVAVKISHLPFDMAPREFKLIFTFNKHCVSADLNPSTRIGIAVFTSGEAAVEARDLLHRKSTMAAAALDDLSFAPLVEVQSLSAVLSSSGSSTCSSIPVNGRRHSPPTNTFTALHISPPQRAHPGNFSESNPVPSSSTGKQFILGEENDPSSLQSVLSSTSEEFNFAEDQDAAAFDSRPSLNRRTSNQAASYSQFNGVHAPLSGGVNGTGSGLPPINGFQNIHTSYPPPLLSPGITSPISPSTHSPGVPPNGSGLVNNFNNSAARSNTPPMPLHHFSHHLYPRVLPAANPADQNPPCNTLYVGNLPMNTSEEELKALFSRQKGYKRLCFRTKSNGPMCFVEFEDVAHATRALTELYGRGLSNSVKGGIRLSFSKNPLGVRNSDPTRRDSRVFLG